MPNVLLMWLLQQKALVRRKRFAQALEVLRAVDALERQEADGLRAAARQANAQALQVGAEDSFTKVLRHTVVGLPLICLHAAPHVSSLVVMQPVIEGD